MSPIALRARKLVLLLAVLTFGLGCGTPDPRVRAISPEGFLDSPPRDALVLDVRSSTEFASGHVPGARNLPHDQLAEALASLEAHKRTPVIVYCESGRRAGGVTSQLLEAGFEDVRHLEGDMRAWRADGRPTEAP